METFEEAMTDMPDHFVMGTMRGSFIHKLLTMSESILRPALNLQMRVPIINEKNVIESAIEIDETEQKIGLIDFSRPSDYRMKAIEAKSAAINVGDVDSHLSGTSRLSTVATSIESLKTGNTPYEGKCQLKP
jgi:dynein heavy chain